MEMEIEKTENVYQFIKPALVTKLEETITEQRKIIESYVDYIMNLKEENSILTNILENMEEQLEVHRHIDDNEKLKEKEDEIIGENK